MNTNKGKFDDILNEAYDRIDEDFKTKIDTVNNKIKINAKLSLLGIALTTITGIPSLSKATLTLEEMKYFFVPSVFGILYHAYSNFYRKRHLEENQLLTSGPYSYHRNPEYVGDMIMGAGLGAIVVNAFYSTGNIIAASLALLTMGVMARGKTLTIEGEDLILEQKFGDKFREYRKSVPKYIPKIANLFK